MFYVILFIAIAIILGVFLRKNTQVNFKVFSPHSRNEIGMYNMKSSEYYNKQFKETGDEMFQFLYKYNYLIALGCQGRMDELEYQYHQINADSKISNNFKILMERSRDSIFKIAKIADKLDQSEMNTRNNETLGQYMDRRLSNNKTFMIHYNALNDFDFQKHYRENILLPK